MTDEQFAEGIRGQMEAAPSLVLGPETRVAIFSDLHMGDGSANDDLRHNGPLLSSALERYYLPRGSTLVLNGDIEDLQKFRLAKIRAAWGGLFALFDGFYREGRLPESTATTTRSSSSSPLSLSPVAGSPARLGPRSLYVFHGHQASGFFAKHNDLAGAGVRYVVHTLGIRNRSPSTDSGRRYRVERRIYDFCRGSGIVSAIGHTHRPLFESLSKYDRLRYDIERLCAEYSGAAPGRRAEIASTVDLFKRARPNGTK